MYRPKVCDACHERPATVFTTSIVEGHATNSQLCDKCCKEFGPADSCGSVGEVREATCCFCGASARVGGTDAFAVVFGAEPQFRYKCLGCSQEFYRYLSTALAIVPANATQVDQDLAGELYEGFVVTEFVDYAERRLKASRAEYDAESMRRDQVLRAQTAPELNVPNPVFRVGDA
jgi:hypothetical protein